jgi:hypothetical protein
MVRAQTAAVDRQVSNEFADMATGEVFRSPHLPSIVAKIFAVDGVQESVTAFVERYCLTEEEAVRWTRWELRIWLNIQNDYIRASASCDPQIKLVSQRPGSEGVDKWPRFPDPTAPTHRP